MISNITIQNVRCFSGRPFSIPLKPLTLLCGTNSSGKSTVLKSLLLLKQTHIAGSRYDSAKGLIHFIGPRIDLGNFTTFVSDNDSTRDVSIKLQFDSQSQNVPEVLRTAFSFGLLGDISGQMPDVDAAALCLVKKVECEYLSPTAKVKNWETRLEIGRAHV